MTLQQNLTLIAAEQFSAMGDIGPAELVAGRIVHLTHPKPRHGRIAMRIAAPLAIFVRDRGLGEVYAAETGFLVARDPDTVRAPDFAFVRADAVSGHDEDEWYPHGPDLAVEVMSPDDRAGAVKAKIRMWLECGARSVWVVDPKKRIATIWRAHGSSESVTENEVLRDESVLPGFSLELQGIF